MDYRRSPWVQTGDSVEGKVLCEDKTKILNGFYTTDALKTFEPCIANCKRCSDGQTCTECAATHSIMDYTQSSWVKQGDPNFGKVVCEEKSKKIDGFYTTQAKKNFEKCIDHCKECSDTQTCLICDSPTDDIPYSLRTDVNPHQCVQCLPEESRYVDPADQQCKPCPSTCSRCESLTECSVCNPNFYHLNLNDGLCEACPETGYRVEANRCLKVCPVKQFRNTRNECVNCPSLYCDRCQDDIGDKCLACSPGYTIDSNDKCWKDCSERQFNPDQNTCKECPIHCSSCQRETGQCQECLSGYRLEGISKKCWKVCSESNQYRKDQSTCLTCPEFCLQCTDTSGTCQ